MAKGPKLPPKPKGDGTNPAEAVGYMALGSALSGSSGGGTAATQSAIDSASLNNSVTTNTIQNNAALIGSLGSIASVKTSGQTMQSTPNPMFATDIVANRINSQDVIEGLNQATTQILNSLNIVNSTMVTGFNNLISQIDAQESFLSKMEGYGEDTQIKLNEIYEALSRISYQSSNMQFGNAGGGVNRTSAGAGVGLLGAGLLGAGALGTGALAADNSANNQQQSNPMMDLVSSLGLGAAASFIGKKILPKVGASLLGGPVGWGIGAGLIGNDLIEMTTGFNPLGFAADSIGGLFAGQQPSDNSGSSLESNATTTGSNNQNVSSIGLNEKSKLIDLPPEANQLMSELGLDQRQYNSFRQALADIESSGGNYGTMGGSSGRFAGAYQLGFVERPEIVETAKSLGVEVPSQEEFLSNPGLQEIFFDQYTLNNHKSLMKRSEEYRNASSEEKLKILGYAHNQGAGGASKWLKTGNVGSDAWGTPGTKYYNAIEDQLTASSEQTTDGDMSSSATSTLSDMIDNTNQSTTVGESMISSNENISPNNSMSEGQSQNFDSIPTTNIVDLGKWLQEQGYRVSEQEAFGGTTPGIHKGKGHAEERAIDVNVGTGNVEWEIPEQKAKFDELKTKLEAAGYKVIWGSQGHYNHMHIETPAGGLIPGKSEGNTSQPGNQDAAPSYENTVTSALGEANDPYAMMSQMAGGTNIDQLSRMIPSLTGMVSGEMPKGIPEMMGMMQGIAGMVAGLSKNKEPTTTSSYTDTDPAKPADAIPEVFMKLLNPDSQKGLLKVFGF
jgi:hypothetical protein